MVGKLLQTQYGLAVLLPEDTLERLGLSLDTEVSVTLKQELGQIIITPASLPIVEVDENFARQLSDFIEEYRPALEALAK
jgi:antitoxin component of MazEF toxin-antitoxin module